MSPTMALFDRNHRQRSSLCSTATVVVFVGLCLLAVWLMSPPDTIPTVVSSSSAAATAAATTTAAVDDAKVVIKKPEQAAAAAVVKEEDSSIDVTNSVKQSSTNVVAENAAELDGLPAAKPAKNNQFDDENGTTEAGALVKPENGETANAAAAAAQGNDVEETVANTDVKESVIQEQQAATDAKDAGAGGQEQSAEQTQTDTKEAMAQDKLPDEMTTADAKESIGVSGGGGGTTKKQTFDDQNGRLDGAGLGKDDGNKTFSEETAKPLAEETAATTKVDTTEAVVVVPTETTTISEEKQQTDNGEPKPEAVEALPNEQADLLTERAAQNGSSFPTQAAESSKEKEKWEKETTTTTKKKKKKNKKGGLSAASWKLCNSSAGADYIPCLDNEEAISKLKTNKHYEHRERHCPAVAPTCLVPAPAAYREPIRWPNSRDKIWYQNVPHTMLAEYKAHQNWVKVSGEYLTFPGGGTQFKHGALRYIDLIQSALPEVAWGRRSRVVLDVGCGVASFGGYLFDRGALTMSLAPKDEHEAQVQFALERGIPAISAVMGTKRLPFPSNVFDVVHCARCRVPWHIDGGKLLLELNRLLRPGGFFVWSATPVYQKLPEDVEIWDEMVKLTKAMCWEMEKKTKDTIDQVGLVIFRKPADNACFEKRRQKKPALCESSDDPNAAWNITLRACMHRIPTGRSVRGSQWPLLWPKRLEKAPYWLEKSQVGVYGKPLPEDFVADYRHWKKVVRSSYISGMGIDWRSVRNVMDMRAVYGGFAAAMRDMSVWVMNVVAINSPDTLPVIYERGLFGIYHDWCESFSTYPRTYDLLHADHLFSKLKSRCKLIPVIVEVDRIMRQNGKLIVRDDKETVDEVQDVVRSLQWEVRMTVSKDNQAMLCARKTTWRPTEIESR